VTSESEKRVYRTIGGYLSEAARTGDMSGVVEYLRKCGRGDGLLFTDYFVLADFFEAHSQPDKQQYAVVLQRKSRRGVRMLRDVEVYSSIREAQRRRAGVADTLGVRPPDVVFVWQKPSGKKPEVAYFTTKKGGERIDYQDAPKRLSASTRQKLSDQAWEKIANDHRMSASHVRQVLPTYEKARKAKP